VKAVGNRNKRKLKSGITPKTIKKFKLDNNIKTARGQSITNARLTACQNARLAYGKAND
jgi:hypothetical protein